MGKSKLNRSDLKQRLFAFVYSTNNTTLLEEVEGIKQNYELDEGALEYLESVSKRDVRTKPGILLESMGPKSLCDVIGI